ncbi:MAG: YhjD/YihY/BrkB family envelope integrity protein, partial [Lactovum sp.]
YSSELYHFLDDSTLFIVAIVSFFVLLILYRLMPNVQIKKIKYIFPGSFFSVLVLVFLPNFFGKYISTISSENTALVSSVVIFIPMIWFIFISRVLIIGAMMNAIYQKYYEGNIEARLSLRDKIINFKEKKLP